MPDTPDFHRFGNGRYRFHFGLKQLLQLERECGGTDRDGIARPKSYQVIMDEMGDGLGFIGEQLTYAPGGTALLKDTRIAARLALVGGGAGLVDGEDVRVTEALAVQLVDDFVGPDSEQGLIVAQYAVFQALRRAVTGIQIKKKDEAADLAIDGSASIAA